MGDEYRIVKGQVVDNNDPEKLGRLKVRVFPEMVDVNDNLLPWVKPINSASTDNKQSFNPLKQDTLLWVLVTSDWKSFYYIGEYMIESKVSFDIIDTTASSVTDLSSYSYENVRAEYYEDGTIKFHNLASGDYALIHSTGNYVLFKGDGSIIVKNTSGSNITIDNTGKITLEGTTGITLSTPDSIIWQPNIVPNCFFTGAPHGGTTGGISTLKGG